MKNLQDLYDFYIKTKPSAGKVRTATTVLIHICKALNTDAPEEVMQDMYGTIPQAIEEYYGQGINRALQDKSMLAEMIGRYGPRDGWETVIDKLLDDENQNLRQFTFQSLGYAGNQEPALILPYIIRFKESADLDMRVMSIKLMCRLLLSEHQSHMKREIQTWSMKENRPFLSDIRECVLRSKDSPQKIQLMTWLDEKVKFKDS